MGIGREAEMLSMGMRYIPVVTEGGGTIEKLATFVSSESILGLGPHIRQLKELEMIFKQKDRAEPEFLMNMSDHSPMLHTLTLKFTYQSPLETHWPLIAVLPNLKNLVELRICFSGSDVELEKLSISDHLTRCPSLKRLLMILPRRTNTDISLSLLKSISSLLTIEKINYLLLRHFNVSSRATTVLAKSLQSSTCSLQTLELHLCTFSSEEAFKKLAMAIAESKCLQKMTFACKSMSTKQAIILASTLGAIKGALKEIDLTEEKHIGEEGARILLEAVNSLNNNKMRLHIHGDLLHQGNM